MMICSQSGAACCIFGAIFRDDAHQERRRRLELVDAESGRPSPLNPPPIKNSSPRPREGLRQLGARGDVEKRICFHFCHFSLARRYK